jgi:pimeloyl-ACP methyl ester carboxylesterase
MRTGTSRPRIYLLILLSATAIILLFTGIWTWWAESNLDKEREVRNLVQDQLKQWFPEQMQASTGLYGLFRHQPDGLSSNPGRIVLVHGLDEPGGIWNDLIPVLEALDMEVWQFRYPNDQAIDRSVQLLAAEWARLDEEKPVVLIGHSMGGLVIRDFVSRLRHPVGAPSSVQGPAVTGVILVGTPSQGSEWARLRVWLELREFFTTVEDRRFSLFAALSDGTGAAKVDLHPKSAFLAELNSRAWPQEVSVKIIGGSLPNPSPMLEESFRVIREDLVSTELDQVIKARLTDLGNSLGDGAVPVASLAFPGGPTPSLVPASHRGLLVRRFASDPEPPAIAYIVESITEWYANNSTPPW